MNCTLCPRECNVDRDRHIGFCGTGKLPVIARVAPHYDEEPPISGTNGAGTIFFSGCSLRCAYCQNYEISALNKGKLITPYELSEQYRRLESMGVHNIELVTPTHFADAIIESFRFYRPDLPVIYNSSGYEKVETLKKLEGLIDVYLPDFKYSDNALAEKLSRCPDYVERTTAAIDEMIRQCGDSTYEEGLIKRGIIIRHLVLPSHVKNSFGVLQIIKEHWNDRIPVSLMAQYMPAGKADEYPDINRRITKREYRRVLERYYDLGFDGFAQELTSADQKYIPEWDFYTNP